MRKARRKKNDQSKREYLVQARLNAAELERLSSLRLQTGLSDSALVREGLNRLAAQGGSPCG
jgi:hypothetical protein